jgi:hypothetical protein
MFAVDTTDSPADEIEAVPEAFPPDQDAADDADSPGAEDAMSTMEAPAEESAAPTDTPTDTGGSGADVVELDRFTEAEIAEFVRSLLEGDGTAERSAERLDVCPAVLDEVATDPSLVTLYDSRQVVVGTAGELVRVVDPIECQVLVEVERAHTSG